MLRRPGFEITGWHVSQLGGGAGNPVSVGLYRLSGSGQDGTGHANWSIVLKIIQNPANVGATNMGEGDDLAHWNYWRREPLVYQSGLLEGLPAGLSAPHFYGAFELPGGIIWLWLEDIPDPPGAAWTLDRYARVARCLGELNGSHIEAEKLPAYPWLSRHQSRQWVANLPQWQSLPWEHPLVLSRYPQPKENLFLRMLTEIERFLDRLEHLPQSLVHGDTYPTNFKLRGDEIVILDWALTGLAPYGDDLGQLVFGAQTNLPDIQPEEVDRVLFNSYLAGLHQGGCDADPRLVRLGYTTSAAIRVGLFQVYLLSLAVGQGMNQEGKAVGAGAYCFENALAAEAYELLESTAA